MFLISRDPPEGGTFGKWASLLGLTQKFLISRDPPEGGTFSAAQITAAAAASF